MLVLIRSFCAAAILAVPCVASAAPSAPAPNDAAPDASPAKPAKPAQGAKAVRTARVQKVEPKACMKPAVDVVAGTETSTFSLTKCDGSPAPFAVDRLSLLARPASAAKPKQTVEVLSKSHGPDVAPGVKRLDPRLLQRLEAVLDHFRKGSAMERVELVSGYRPKSAGSFHQAGKALDFRLDGVTNEAIVAFCKTLPDTGCGYYPNSPFVHIDVRSGGAGHVAWIDVSKPGEAPKYVSAWPMPKDESAKGVVPPTPDTDPLEAPARRRDGHVYMF